MAIQATSEEQLRMRRRARRRLLGAATLLLLAAIVLPMLLDKQPRPLDRDIEIRIPSQTAAPLAAAPPVAASAAPAPAAVPPAPVATDKTAVPPAAAGQTEPTTTPSKLPAESETQHKPAVPKSAPAHKPEPATGQVPEKPAPKAEATHKSPETALERSATPTHFVVQLGAFSNAENVRQLRDRLLAGGIHTYTEALPNGATRVRAGPFKTREQADRTQASIALLGVQAKVVGIDKP